MSRRLFFFLPLLLIGCFFALSLFLDPALVRAGKIFINGLTPRLVEIGTTVTRWHEQHYALSISVYTVLALIIIYTLLPRLVKMGVLSWGFQKKVRAAQELKDDEEELIKQLIVLYKDMGKELKLLQDIGRHRALYPDERYLRTKLTHYEKSLKAMMPHEHKRRK